MPRKILTRYCKECGETMEKCPSCGHHSCYRCNPDVCPRCGHRRDMATKRFEVTESMVVAIVSDNIIIQSKLFVVVADAEKYFVELCKQHGMEDEDAEDRLDDGTFIYNDDKGRECIVNLHHITEH